MRGVVLAFALTGVLVGLGGCSAEGTMTAWRWNRFIARPGDATLEAVLKYVYACQKPGCAQGDAMTAAMIDQLTARVGAGDMRAVRLAMASEILIGDGGGHDGDIAHSFGPVIKAKPEAFLDAALVQTCRRTDYVTTTPYAMTDNDGAQYDELVARRTALMTVTRSYLQPLRDAFVVALDKAIVREDRARIKMPKGLPVDVRLGAAGLP